MLRGFPVAEIGRTARMRFLRCGGFSRVGHFRRPGKGQSTVEAVLVIPVLFVCVLLLVQPSIVLYDRVIMQSAASEACRLLCTLPNDEQGLFDEYVRRRLAAVPQQDCFHVHRGSVCSWVIQHQGGQSDERVSVLLETKVKPLPLIDVFCRAVGATDSEGCWTISVEEAMTTQPTWARQSEEGSDPSSWVGGWL